MANETANTVKPLHPDVNSPACGAGLALGIEQNKNLKEENKEKYNIEIALLASLRDASAIRSNVIRAYNLKIAETTEKEGTAPEYERADDIFAFVSLFYLLTSGLSFYLSNKELPEEQKNRLLYDLIDSVTWSAVAIMRLPGNHISELDASEWDGMSQMLVDGFVIGFYGIELINQLFYDYRQYRYYENLLNENQGNADYQYEKTKWSLSLGKDLIYLSSLITGMALNVSGVIVGATPVGFVLMVAATVVNQIINAGVAGYELNRAFEKYNMENNECKTKIENLSNKLNLLLDTDKIGKEEIQTQINEIKNDQKKLLKELRKAEKDFAFATVRLSTIFISIGFLLSANPIGVMAFVIGIAAYLVVKTAFYAYEKYEASQEKQTTATSSLLTHNTFTGKGSSPDNDNTEYRKNIENNLNASNASNGSPTHSITISPNPNQSQNPSPSPLRKN